MYTEKRPKNIFLETTLERWHTLSTTLKFMFMIGVVSLVVIGYFVLQVGSEVNDLVEAEEFFLLRIIVVLGIILVAFGEASIYQIILLLLIPLSILLFEALLQGNVNKNTRSSMGKKGRSALAVLGLCLYMEIILITFWVKAALIASVPIGLFVALSIVGLSDDRSERKKAS